MKIRVGAILCGTLTALQLCAAQVSGQSLPGRYQLLICERAPCSLSDSSSVVVRGEITLFPEPGLPARLPASARVDLEQSSRWLLRGRSDSINACFSLERVRSYVGEIEVYAGITARGLTTWRMEDGELHVPLYASPDASFDLIGSILPEVISGDGLHRDCCGRGTFPFMVFALRRVGDADIATC